MTNKDSRAGDRGRDREIEKARQRELYLLYICIFPGKEKSAFKVGNYPLDGISNDCLSEEYPFEMWSTVIFAKDSQGLSKVLD